MILYNNAAHPVICMGWHMTLMWNKLAVRAHETSLTPPHLLLK